MSWVLSEKETADIMAQMSEEQREFINNYIKQSKKSKWLQVLAEKKGILIHSEDSLNQVLEKVNDWYLEEILDAGYGNRFYRCECGQSLRFQYIVKNKSENKTYKLGETCLEHYTGLSPSIIQDIKNGLHTINQERDNILIRYKEGEFTELSPYNSIDVPEVMKKQVELGLPLSEKQINKLEIRLKEQKENELIETKRKVRLEHERKLKNFVDSFEGEQKEFVSNLPLKQLEELYDLMQSEDNPPLNEEFFQGIELPTDIKDHIRLGFPLFSMQKLRLNRLWEEKIALQKQKKNAPMDIAYDEFIERHLSTLKAIRAKQDEIPPGLRKDWDTIQKNIREFRQGKPFNYRSWKRNTRNLIAAIKVEEDDYL
ncbi:hypothetical protein RZN22_10390 [Bacillaceae bacterium S4-13-58]